MSRLNKSPSSTPVKSCHPKLESFSPGSLSCYRCHIIFSNRNPWKLRFLPLFYYATSTMFYLFHECFHVCFFTSWSFTRASETREKMPWLNYLPRQLLLNLVHLERGSNPSFLIFFMSLFSFKIETRSFPVSSNLTNAFMCFEYVEPKLPTS